MSGHAFFDFRMQISYFFLKQTNPCFLSFSCAIDVTYYFLALYIPPGVFIYNTPLAEVQHIINQ